MVLLINTILVPPLLIVNKFIEMKSLLCKHDQIMYQLSARLISRANVYVCKISKISLCLFYYFVIIIFRRNQKYFVVCSMRINIFFNTYMPNIVTVVVGTCYINLAYPKVQCQSLLISFIFLFF